MVSEESLGQVNHRISSLFEARKSGNDRVACEWKPRKLSPEDLDRMRREAEVLRNAPPPPPYEGPLVVDMDDVAEQPAQGGEVGERAPGTSSRSR